MNNLVAFYLLKCLWPSMPSGSSLKRPRQAATATTGADLVSPGAQGSADLPTWHGGETVLDVAINELPLADDGQNAPFALVKWGDVPLCVREECSGRCAGAKVGLVLPNAGVSRSYVRWFFQSNSDARITCLIDHNFEHIYGLCAAVDCFRALNQEGRPTLWYKQLWGCRDPSCECQPCGTRLQHTRRR